MAGRLAARLRPDHARTRSQGQIAAN